MAEDPKSPFIASPSTQKDDPIAEIAGTQKQIEDQVRNLFVKVLTERDAARNEIDELKSKLAEEKVASDNKFKEHKEIADREITALRIECQKLREEAQAAKDARAQAVQDAQAASGASQSMPNYAAYPSESVWHHDGSQILVETEVDVGTQNEEAPEQSEPMNVHDEIVVSDGWFMECVAINSMFNVFFVF